MIHVVSALSRCRTMLLRNSQSPLVKGPRLPVKLIQSVVSSSSCFVCDTNDFLMNGIPLFLTTCWPRSRNTSVMYTQLFEANDKRRSVLDFVTACTVSLGESGKSKRDESPSKSKREPIEPSCAHVVSGIIALLLFGATSPPGVSRSPPGVSRLIVVLRLASWAGGFSLSLSLTFSVDA